MGRPPQACCPPSDGIITKFIPYLLNGLMHPFSFFISGIGILATSIMILAGSALVPFFFRDVETPILFSALTALGCLAYSIRHVGGNMLKWTFQASIFTRITLAQVLVVVILTLIGIIAWGWRANAVLLTSAVVTFCCGIWALGYCRQFVKPSTFSRIKAKELIAYSWPLLGLNIFAFFTRSLDRIFLASLMSLGTVGIFAVSAAVASVFETLVSGFFFAWGPFILSTFREEASPQRYADFFDSSADGILVIEVSGRVLFCNPAACTIVGRSARELRSIAFDDILSKGIRTY